MCSVDASQTEALRLCANKSKFRRIISTQKALRLAWSLVSLPDNYDLRILCLDPDQPLSNSAAGLRANLFATQSIIPHKKQAHFQYFE